MDYCVDSRVSQFLFFWPGVMEMLNSCPVPLLASWVLTDLELNEHHILLQLVQLCEQLLSHQQSSYVTVNVADVCHRYTNKLSNILRSSEGGCVFQIHFPGQVLQVSLTSKKGIFFFLPSSDQHFDIHHPVWSEVRGRRREPHCPAKPLCRYCRWLPCAPRWCFVLKHLCRKAAIVWPCPHPCVQEALLTPYLPYPSPGMFFHFPRLCWCPACHRDWGCSTLEQALASQTAYFLLPWYKMRCSGFLCTWL